MPMDASEVRELLVEARHEFDKRAKAIVEGLGDDARDEEFESRLSEAITGFRSHMIEAFDEEFAGPIARLLAAFDQWEIMEKTPLNDDDSFMHALRDLLRVDIKGAVDKAIGEQQKKHG